MRAEEGRWLLEWRSTCPLQLREAGKRSTYEKYVREVRTSPLQLHFFRTTRCRRRRRRWRLHSAQLLSLGAFQMQLPESTAPGSARQTEGRFSQKGSPSACQMHLPGAEGGARPCQLEAPTGIQFRKGTCSALGLLDCMGPRVSPGAWDDTLLQTKAREPCRRKDPSLIAGLQQRAHGRDSKAPANGGPLSSRSVRIAINRAGIWATRWRRSGSGSSGRAGSW